MCSFSCDTMGCYLTEYQTHVDTWVARIIDGSITSKRNVTVHGICKRQVATGIGMPILSTATLAVLLVTGVETNSGPGVESEKFMTVICSRCDKILKSATQCDTCRRWFHNSCGNVKTRVAECGKWVCDTCRPERLQILEDKLHDALKQTETQSRKNKTLEEKLCLTRRKRSGQRRKGTGPSK